MPAKPEVLQQVQKLLETSPKLLSTIDKQKRYVAEIYSRTPPCWLCAAPVSFFEAVDEHYEIGGGDGNFRRFTCPQCGAPLHKSIPFFAGTTPWFWSNPQAGGRLSAPVRTEIIEAMKRLIEKLQKES